MKALLTKLLILNSHVEFSYSMSVPTPIDTLTSGLASIIRLPYGTTVLPSSRIKKELASIEVLKLYDLENNANCRLVRELLSELDLNVKEVIPCGKGSRYVQEELILPTVVFKDNTDTSEKTIEGSPSILEYLKNFVIEEENEEEENNVSFSAPDWTSFIASLLRISKGETVSKAALSQMMPSYENLQLYNYENNQFCRLVREVLVELDLPYELINAAKNSPTRPLLAKFSDIGSTQCPFLYDPNFELKILDSKEIILHLYKKYANWTPPNEILKLISNLVIETLFAPIFKNLALPESGTDYNKEETKDLILDEINSSKVVVYTYKLSPFCSECTDLLSRLDIEYEEISLGFEWIPFLCQSPEKRAMLGQLFDQTSLPHVFINGKSIGGLFSGKPGLVPLLEKGEFFNTLEDK